MNRTSILILLFALAWISAASPLEAQTRGDRLASTIDAVLSDLELEDAFWGIHVVDLQSGEVLYARNARNNFIPASNQKVITTAIALDALGPDFQYVTEVFLDGVRRGHVFDGNIVIRGSGDPTISDRRFTQHFPTTGDPHAVFRQWADSLAALGITHVTGHVIGDDRYFDDELLGRGWAWDDEPTPFAAQISALSFNEGRLSVTLRGTAVGRRASVELEPETDYVYVVNRSETVNSSAESILRRDQGGNTVWVESRVPRGESLTRTISVHNPTRYFVHALRDVLRRSGIVVDGDPVIVADWWQGLDYSRMQRIATHTSPPLSQLAEVTNKISQNLYAEHLLRTVGAERCPRARARATANGRSSQRVRCGSAEAGFLAAEEFLEATGVRVDRVRFVDGSGMSHYNMFAPVDMTALLTYMWHHPDDRVRGAFVSSMAIGGVDGTLRRRFTSGQASGSVFAKTGTVTGARNLAGYVTTSSGRPLAFAVMSNLFGTSTGTITRAQDAIVEELARQ